jgi:hypothetical protein
MIQWLKDNPKLVIMVSITATIAAILFTAQGCNLASMVEVDVPPYVKTAVAESPEDMDKTYTLDDMPVLVDQWTHYVESNDRRLKAAIEDAEERYVMIGSLLDVGYDFGSQVAGTVPGGALILTGLSLFTGILMKRPGEDKRVAKEKEDSYNAGLKKAREMLASTTKNESKEVSPS